MDRATLRMTFERPCDSSGGVGDMTLCAKWWKRCRSNGSKNLIPYHGTPEFEFVKI